MTIAESLLTCLDKYATFSGRARPSEFWWFALFAFLVPAVLSFVVPALGFLLALTLLIPSFAVGARRLHDSGRSGWWQWLILVPFLGAIVLIVLWALPSRD